MSANAKWRVKNGPTTRGFIGNGTIEIDLSQFHDNRSVYLQPGQYTIEFQVDPPYQVPPDYVINVIRCQENILIAESQCERTIKVNTNPTTAKWKLLGGL